MERLPLVVGLAATDTLGRLAVNRLPQVVLRPHEDVARERDGEPRQRRPGTSQELDGPRYEFRLHYITFDDHQIEMLTEVTD